MWQTFKKIKAQDEENGQIQTVCECVNVVCVYLSSILNILKIFSILKKRKAD